MSATRPQDSSLALPSATQTDESLVSSATSYRYEQPVAHQRAATVIAVALAMTLAGGLVAIGRRAAAFASPASRGIVVSATAKAGVSAAPPLARQAHARDVTAESRSIEPAPAAQRAVERAPAAPEQPARVAAAPGRLRGGSSVARRQATPVRPNGGSSAADPGALYDLYWSNSSGHEPASDDADFSQLGGRY